MSQSGIGAALLLGLSVAALAQDPQGKVVDAKGYPLRGAAITGEGYSAVTDWGGLFGEGASAGRPLPERKNFEISGRMLRIPEGSGIRQVTLLYPDGRRVSPTILAGARLDLEGLGAGAPGLYLLKAEGPSGSFLLPMMRLYEGSWVASARRASAPPAGLAKSAAPTEIRIAKIGYKPATKAVPTDGRVGTIVMESDWGAGTVDAPFDVNSYYASSGWAGDYKAVAVDGNNAVNPRPDDADKKHVKWTFPISMDSVLLGWAAVVWQYPENNWGDKAGRKVTRASKITFWAKGDKGGEELDFHAGFKGFTNPPDPGKTQDSFYAELLVTLTAEWKKYEIDLALDADLSSVISGFVWGMAAPADAIPRVFYLDDIRYE